MTISDKTRKLLWGRSGNQCAFCRRQLIFDRADEDPESVVGDECHIISLNGPRADATYPPERLDAYENLILLCKVHHKLVDDQVVKYSADVLRELKRKHESRVATLLREKPAQPPKRPEVLERLLTGDAVFAITDGACAYMHGHDPISDEVNVELVGGFLQDVQDWGDLLGDLGAGERVRAAFALTKQINELEAAGWWVFGARDPRMVRMKDELVNWPAAVIRVLRKDNPDIQVINVPVSGA